MGEGLGLGAGLGLEAGVRIRGGVRIRQSYSDFNERGIIWQGVENGHNTGSVV